MKSIRLKAIIAVAAFGVAVLVPSLGANSVAGWSSGTQSLVSVEFGWRIQGPSEEAVLREVDARVGEALHELRETR